MSENCPLCERPLPATLGIRVDLQGCIVAANGKSERVPPMVAEFLFVMAEVHPRAVARTALIDKLWGVTAPDNAVTILNVHACRVRKVARRLGFDLECVFGRSYRLTPRRA